MSNGGKAMSTVAGTDYTCSKYQLGFPGAAVVKYLPANAGDARGTNSIPGLGRAPGVGCGKPLQYWIVQLENPTESGAWWATVHGVTKESDATGHSHTRCHASFKQQWMVGT